jgi:3-oxoacyl-[acyl-carrier protein] reductase
MDRAAPDAVVVTGAGRGIGRAVALAVADDGVPVLCLARTATAQATRDVIRERATPADALSIDLADHQQVESAVANWIVGRPYRRLGVVLAAAELGPIGPLEASDLSAWGHAFAVNVLGNLAVVRGLLPRMLESCFGRIVFFGGGGAAYEYPVFPAYACSKAALVRAVENLHEDLRDRGDFSVVCLAPGAVETDMLGEVRVAGAEVRTTGSLADPIRFVRAFLTSPRSSLSGRFVHVRDPWADVLDESTDLAADLWKLRRVE